MYRIVINTDSLILNTAHHNVGGLPEVSYYLCFTYVYVCGNLLTMTAHDERRELL